MDPLIKSQLLYQLSYAPGTPGGPGFAKVRFITPGAGLSSPSGPSLHQATSRPVQGCANEASTHPPRPVHEESKWNAQCRRHRHQMKGIYIADHGGLALDFTRQAKQARGTFQIPACREIR